MTLSAGDRLGCYEILGPLGAGGMGEVYRAHDARLDRNVAIKVLPEAVAQDEARLARFEREAKLLASLSHQNIATLHGLEEHAGQRFLIMELAEGETLAERIKKGAIPVDDALPIALQIAEGLEAAHEQGIIHRDLKPANVMVSAEGNVKVLDFGLAKAWQPEEGDADLTHSPTLTAQMTAAGVLLGTAAYMSPEQARGKPVDKRADIWAFGVVLWEMLTGKGLFAGETTTDVLLGIIGTAPDWHALPEGVPSGLHRVLRRCLEKEPRGRLRDIGDARLEMEEIDRRGVDAESTTAIAVRRPATMALAGSMLAFAAGVLLAVWAWTRIASDDPPPNPESRWVVRLESPLQLAVGGRTNPLAIAADGSRLVFAAEERGTSRLYLRELDDLETRPIPGTEGARNPFFSPDGKQLGFFTGNKLQRTSISGGTPRVICESALDDLGASWVDDIIVFASYGTGLSLVSAEGGVPEAITTLDYDAGEVQHRWPQILPDGDTVLFTVATDKGSRVGLVSIARRKKWVLQEIVDLSRARYVADGYLIYGQAGGLRAVAFDPVEGSTTGEAVTVLASVASVPDLGNAFFAVSQTGNLIYVPGTASGETELAWVDRRGREVPAAPGRASFMHPRLSPDGTRATVSVGSEVGLRQVWIYDLERGTRRLLGGEGSQGLASWTPDGKSVVFSSNQNGNWDLFISEAQGGSTPRELLVRQFEQWGGEWTPDGRYFVYYDVKPGSGRDIWFLDVASGEVTSYLETRFNERASRFSPDGRWMAYVSNESGQDEVYVDSFPERGSKWAISTSGGTEATWSRDGRELYYRQGNQMMVVEIEPGGGFSASKPRVLFDGRYETAVAGNPNYDVAPDGRRFLMIKRSEASARVQLTVVLNWFSVLDRLSPDRTE